MVTFAGVVIYTLRTGSGLTASLFLAAPYFVLVLTSPRARARWTLGALALMIGGTVLGFVFAASSSTGGIAFVLWIVPGQVLLALLVAAFSSESPRPA